MMHDIVIFSVYFCFFCRYVEFPLVSFCSYVIRILFMSSSIRASFVDIRIRFLNGCVFCRDTVCMKNLNNILFMRLVNVNKTVVFECRILLIVNVPQRNVSKTVVFEMSHYVNVRQRNSPDYGKTIVLVIN